VELTNQFSVSVPLDQAWAVLTDLKRIAPCMPGFQLQEVDGDEYRGLVRVKVGPMIAQYKGVASFRERDEIRHRAVVRAEGRDTRGQGNASATVTATLEPGQGGTRVTLHTELTVTGKVAQFGRGVRADVSRKLLRQFVQALEADVLRGVAVARTGAKENTQAAAIDAPAPNSPSGPSRVEMQKDPTAGALASGSSSEPIDLLATAGSSLIKRVGPLAALGAALVAVVWFLLRH